ncbi:EF-hand [Meredithblackwellia eburnea MCA 4105]
MSYNSPYPPPSGGYQQQGQYGAPQNQYGGGPPQGQYGGGPQQQYGQPQGQFGGNQYGGGPPQQGYNPQQQGYGQQQGGYGGPQQGGYGGGGYNQQQQGGYGGQQQQGGDPQLRQWFNSVDLDRSGQISQMELKQALVNGDWSPFSDDTIKMLMNMFDTDRSGSIGFNEFQGLWEYVKQWQGIFRQFDRDRSGSIDSQELTQALAQFGYNLPPNLINILQKKYNPPPPKSGAITAGPPRGINFDAFVRCCVTTRQLSEAFKRADQDQDGYVNMGYMQFLEMAISAP